jgi:AcrR family transcriptional regulator
MTRSVKRPYVSAKRAAQAQATRESIVEAALRLFADNGYVATTIQGVADEAGVAVQTVYAVFGNKRELLRRALEAAVTGDAEPMPLNERPNVRAISEEPDALRRAEMGAAMVAEISPRLAPIVRVVREAAAVDPDFAVTAAEITMRRREDMVASAELLAGPGGLDMDPEDAIGTLYVLYSPDVYTSLTEDLGWPLERYERWLSEMLYRHIASSGGVSPRRRRR